MQVLSTSKSNIIRHVAKNECFSLLENDLLLTEGNDSILTEDGINIQIENN